MDIPLLTREECQAIDRLAIDVYGMSGLVLMENAGRGTVDVLERLGIAGPVVVLCGKGNNAGDGFVIARHLAIRGYECCVVLLCPPTDLRGDAAANFAILKNGGAPIFEGSAASRAAHGPPGSPNEGPNERPPRLGGPTFDGADWIVDAMLGTGARGEPRPPLDAAIDWMNAQSCHKLAVDVPSGLDCDTGEPSSHTVRADHTCTFAAMKIGFTLGQAARYTGTVHVCDIGVPPRLIEEVAKQRS
jgi:NAD(P)H-hydrate epimerase